MQDYIKTCLNCWLEECLPDSSRCPFNKAYGIGFKPKTLFQDRVGKTEFEDRNIFSGEEKKKINKVFKQLGVITPLAAYIED